MLKLPFEKESNKSQTENDKHPSTCHGFRAAQSGLFLFMEVGTKSCTSPSGKSLSSGAGAAKRQRIDIQQTNHGHRPRQHNAKWDLSRETFPGLLGLLLRSYARVKRYRKYVIFRYIDIVIYYNVLYIALQHYVYMCGSKVLNSTNEPTNTKYDQFLRYLWQRNFERWPVHWKTWIDSRVKFLQEFCWSYMKGKYQIEPI